MKENFLKIKEKYFPERKFRAARVWSNKVLREIAHLFNGDIINVSEWEDGDKRGGFYRNYFTKANSYTVSNYSGDMGFQNKENEILLDLEKELDEKYISKYDVVFNHTVLEHIFDVDTAFKNLCLMSKDIVIVVVPFLQEMHYSNSYKDYWRFTPFALKKMFEKNGMKLVFIDANNSKNESIYILAVGSKNPNKWTNYLKINEKIFNNLGNYIIN
jgi:hypothetical protein